MLPAIDIEPIHWTWPILGYICLGW